MPLNGPISYMLCFSQGQSFFEASLTCKPKIIHVSHPAAVNKDIIIPIFESMLCL